MPKTGHNTTPDNSVEEQLLPKKGEQLAVQITRPNMMFLQFRLKGTEPLSVCRFSEKAKAEMMKTQSEGSTARSKKQRTAKDFHGLFVAAQYRDRKEGWCGLHAASIRNASISACRIVGFKMTLAKLGLFVMADGYAEDGTPLLRIYGSEPTEWIAPVRNANNTFDLRARPRWEPGEWELRPRIRFDGDMFTPTDVTNLIMRVGLQVGLGEGRPDSKDSAGIGFGLFELVAEEQEKAA